MGDLPAARGHVEEADRLVEDACASVAGPRTGRSRRQRIALGTATPAAAVPASTKPRASLRGTRPGRARSQLAVTALAERRISRPAIRPPRSAATERAIAMHRTHDGGEIEGMSAASCGGSTPRRCAANGESTAARAGARDGVSVPASSGIAGLSDEGLRRNYLNKVDAHREIVAALARRTRAAPPVAGSGAPPHLAGEANLREPFERLVDTGLRLNELRSAAELHEFLIDEATELSRRRARAAGAGVARRPATRRLAACRTARMRRRCCRRRHAVARGGAPHPRREPAPRPGRRRTELDQRSCLVAPLIAQRELLGYLYADIEGAFGRFHDADRDLLGDAREPGGGGARQRRAGRGAGAQGGRAHRAAQLEQRASELAIINSIQQGMAAELDFQAIVDLVGDKLREVFSTRRHRHLLVGRADATGCTTLYAYEHGDAHHGAAATDRDADGPLSSAATDAPL